MALFFALPLASSLDENFFVYSLAGVLAGAVLMMGYQRWKYTVYKIKLAARADEILNEANRQAESMKSQIVLEAKEDALEIKSKGETEIADSRRKQLAREEKLDRRSEQLDLQEADLRKQQRGLENAQQRLDSGLKMLTNKREELGKLEDQQKRLLEAISGMTRAEAKEQLLEVLNEELEHERGKVLLKQKKQITEAAKEQSRQMLLTAMQRYSSAFTADSTTSTVDVPTDDMKGRIIGREGRNIRAFEKATGIDVIIDDTPGVVIVSGFDPVRREIARRSLTNLIADGRIHPSKIEEVVEETQREINELIMQKGREAADEVNIAGLHDRLIELLGRLYFRTSYSQNVLRHSIEVAFLSGMIAEMLGMNGDVARRCGLLHDIGKAADHELEGGHPKIGADILRRHGESPEVVHAAFGHHDEIVIEHPYTMVVATADACSASRPGARRESLERYIKRMEELEAIAKRFEGVREAYAISAGRELRVIVDSTSTNDEQSAVICHEIAQAFERELMYPGEIKVTVLRESSFTEIAK
ncbi:ribonuclease Y [Rhodopirellula sp. MGV]|uniref:ribonuclease Y n=1 Tax=Rhodopirellula sp. MGV TaxID=2023130 RepID=UPI000B96E0F1|nr:ribonuclease Y [Rhodopirellula sp. MGV]OYP29496.1 ribonuclease Y [Rhodopirellula sp. MGV]PNY33799.1 ribonuclease Y [Rhodopirellula baltica]